MVPEEAAPAGYEVIRELGRGGLGAVVLARHVALDRLCAVKRLLVAPAEASETVARFRREATVLSRLDDPSIVRLYDVVSGSGRLFVVMEYVEGHDLRVLLDDDALDASSAVSILGDVAGALGHAAARGVVHRDVKPANVLVRTDGRAKLADFGVARILGESGTFRSTVGTAVGSVAYMAPEQLVGDDEIGAPADVYGFSILAYEVTVGRMPFDAATADRVIDAHLHGRPIDPTTVVAGYPPTVARLLLAGLERDPSARPAVGDVAAALADVDPTGWPWPSGRGRVRSAVQIDPTATSSPVDAPMVTEVRPGSTARSEAATTVEETSGVDENSVHDPQPARADRWIEQPVYVPEPAPSSRRGRRLAVVAVAVVAVLAAAVVVAVVARRHDPVTVGRVDVRVNGPAAAGCPGATFRFVGTIAASGSAGPVRVQWTAPDGAVERPIQLESPGGSRSLRAELDFKVSGHRTLSGPAVLRVFAPGDGFGRSGAVVYSCP